MFSFHVVVEVHLASVVRQFILVTQYTSRIVFRLPTRLNVQVVALRNRGIVQIFYNSISHN